MYLKTQSKSRKILFIDASQHFEKVGKQNYLRAEHIEKLLNAYKQREFIDKYAYVAKMDEIIENDYNLNIPRYVDTFEEEEPVDLEAVSKELSELESDIKEIDAKIQDYCKELGIDAPK